ncbi:MAG: nitroreductase family protein [Eubacteriales bacterium]|nr:nitroreductase family protein [Eubacteriales bacterium]
MERINERFYPMIMKRKSFHLFQGVKKEPISQEEMKSIYDAYKEFVPLDPDIRTEIKIVPASEANCARGEEYCILMYSENKNNSLQNIGYIGEQLDLYLVSRNIGTLWYGMGKPELTRCNGLDFVIMIAISKVADERKFRKDMFKARRKERSEIWHGEELEPVSDIVRFAPSACNTQPWLVEHTGRELKLFRYKKPGRRGILPMAKISFYNRIDIGIFMCFLELCLAHEGIGFERECYADDGSDSEKTFAAVYRLDQADVGASDF